MKDSEIIENTVRFVKETLKDVEGGHDWFHTQRVFNSSLRIARHEEVDLLVVGLGALLHDIADAKFHGGDESVGPRKAREFLKSLPVKKTIVKHVINIIRFISFKNSLEKGIQSFRSRELEVVRDADMLDAMGAIGIARAFSFGGFRNNPLYDPEQPPDMALSKQAYKKGNRPTINHFYEKLLLLKDRMSTATGKEMAEERHNFMLKYLKQFYREWEVEP